MVLELTLRFEVGLHFLYGHINERCMYAKKECQFTSICMNCDQEILRAGVEQ